MEPTTEQPMPHHIFDSHAHYDVVQFDPDRNHLLSHTLPADGICGVINMGTDLDSCRKTITLIEQYRYFFGAVGIHPECAQSLPPDWMDQLSNLLEHDRIVAVGEIGLDYHYEDACPRARQRSVFRAQLALANAHDKPVVIHDREAHGDTMQLLHELRPQGVLHCYSGSLEMARQLVKLGLYIGIGGVVTFKNARTCAEVAKWLPLDRLLLETDAPYLSPVPFRGKRNQSSYIRYTAERIAELRGCSAQEIVDAATENTIRLFHLEAYM